MSDTPAKDPVIAQKAPYPVEVTAGKTYFWCACGRSAKQPFCDGSHKDTGFSPVKYTAEEDKQLFFCGCKHTGKPPFCDGTHSKL
jgi:CDGSH-type Zn-finger protein